LALGFFNVSNVGLLIDVEWDVSHYFYLQFPNDILYGACFYMFICHQLIFVEVSGKVFVPNSLSDLSFLQVCDLSIILLTLSLADQKSLILMKSRLSIFFS
jgi:hypothetical protein